MRVWLCVRACVCDFAFMLVGMVWRSWVCLLVRLCVSTAHMRLTTHDLIGLFMLGCLTSMPRPTLHAQCPWHAGCVLAPYAFLAFFSVKFLAKASICLECLLGWRRLLRRIRYTIPRCVGNRLFARAYHDTLIHFLLRACCAGFSNR